MEEIKKENPEHENEISTMPFTSVVEDNVGLPPGSPVYIGDKEAENANFSIYTFDDHFIQVEAAPDFKSIHSCIDKSKINWINVNGISSEIIESLCMYFDINPLTMEDILNTKHRPKIDSYEEYLFFIVKMLSGGHNSVKTEQISFILKGNTLITIQEEGGDCFEPVRVRIRNKNGKIRKKGADYLAYALLDVIVDNYFVVLENLGSKIENTDRDILRSVSSDKTLLYLQDLKSETSHLKRIIWPTRELVGKMARLEEDHFSQALDPYFRDLYENILQTIEAIDSYTEQIGNLIEYYLSAVNNRMSEVMKTLTIMSAIFIPLTFIAGLYGMNFKHMPELDEKIAYPVVLCVMALIAIGELIYFKFKKWF